GWSIDAETVRRYTHAEASDAATARAERTALPKAFARAEGEHEVHLDAGKVNTPDGWRDVKVAVFACRQRGVLADSDDYTQGDLAAWLEPARRRLVGDGYAGVCEVVAQPIAGAAAQRRGAEVSGGVLNYFAGQQQRLGYAVRLRRGQVIGSGLVEGTIKEL